MPLIGLLSQQYEAQRSLPDKIFFVEAIAIISMRRQPHEHFRGVVKCGDSSLHQITLPSSALAKARFSQFHAIMVIPVEGRFFKYYWVTFHPLK